LYSSLSLVVLLHVSRTLQVIKNIVHVTTAGVIASWFFLDPVPSNPTLNALKRASWGSLGSICLGSLLIAIIKALRQVVRMGRRARHPVTQCIVECLLGLLESAVRFFNTYAFTQVSSRALKHVR
jgi:hypothetical protein